MNFPSEERVVVGFAKNKKQPKKKGERKKEKCN